MQDEPKNYYEILELTPQAEPEDIRRAYIRLARKYHPDHNGNNNSVIMAELNHVYEVLSNTQKRQEYDKRFAPAQVYDFSKPKVEQNNNMVNHQAVYQAKKSNFISRYWKEGLAIVVVLLMLYAMVYLIMRIINLSTKLPG
jgi:curved DNA-binding protein CbpA